MRGITLFSLFNLALKNIVYLIIVAIVFGAGAFAYCEYVAVPRYSATGSVLITNGAIDLGTDIDENGEAKKLENTDVIASINFMETATDMLKQNDIYKSLAEKTNYKYSYGGLMNMSNVERREDRSLYIDITFTATSRQDAVALVNEFLALTPDFFKSQVTSVNVSYFEVDSASQIYPNSIVTTLLFAVIGAVVLYAILLIIFLMNTTITGEDDFKDRFDLPIVGSIPDFATARSAKYGKYGKYNKYGKYGYYGNYDNYGYYGRGSRRNGK